MLFDQDIWTNSSCIWSTFVPITPNIRPEFAFSYQHHAPKLRELSPTSCCTHCVLHETCNPSHSPTQLDRSPEISNSNASLLNASPPLHPLLRKKPGHEAEALVGPPHPGPAPGRPGIHPCPRNSEACHWPPQESPRERNGDLPQANWPKDVRSRGGQDQGRLWCVSGEVGVG